MKQHKRMILLTLYDLLLAIVAIYEGTQMIDSRTGVFIDYPKEWLTKLPFTSWVLPGILAIVLFGVGNLLAAIYILFARGKMRWIASAALGALLLVSFTAQIVILGECYMATAWFLLFGIIQLCLCVSAAFGNRKVSGKAVQ